MFRSASTQADPIDARPTSWWRARVEAADDPFDDESLTRMPGLAAPFALVAAVATLFSVLGLGAIFDPMLDALPLTATAFAVFAGAAAGGILRRWRKLHDPFRAPDSRAYRVALVVVITGTAIGAVLGLSTWQAEGGMPCAVGGALCALGFLPCCFVVLAASKRAARARMGSVVADVDRRTVFVALLEVVAFSAGIQAPALALGRYSVGVPPLLQIGVSLAIGATCSAAIAWLARRDREARARFADIVREAPWLDRAGANEDATAEAIDLGLGADRWARASVLATYRTTCRPEVVLQGSVEDARRAIEEAVAQRRRALVFTLAILAATSISVVLGELVRARPL